MLLSQVLTFLLRFQVWNYNDGEVVYLGTGHSGDIMRVKICPKQQHIVSVSADGAVLRWKFPL